MQVTITIPDNLPPAIAQQQIKELEERLQQQAKRLNTRAHDKAQRYQAIKKISQEYAKLPVFDPRSADEILGYDKSPIGLWEDE
jgi:hypothetical protein